MASSNIICRVISQTQVGQESMVLPKVTILTWLYLKTLWCSNILHSHKGLNYVVCVTDTPLSILLCCKQSSLLASPRQRWEPKEDLYQAWMISLKEGL